MIKEILEDLKHKRLDRGDAERLLTDYMNTRLSAQKCGWRNNDGAKAKVMANGVEDLFKPVIATLRNLDSGTYYPMTLDGIKCTNRDEVLNKLIKELK